MNPLAYDIGFAKTQFKAEAVAWPVILLSCNCCSFMNNSDLSALVLVGRIYK